MNLLHKTRKRPKKKGKNFVLKADEPGGKTLKWQDKSTFAQEKSPIAAPKGCDRGKNSKCLQDLAHRLHKWLHVLEKHLDDDAPIDAVIIEEL